MNKKLFAVSVILLVVSMGLVACGSSLPAECTTEGSVAEIILGSDDYFILGDEPVLWTGVSFQPGPGYEGGGFYNIPLSVGESYGTGLTEDGDDYYYEWTIFRCGGNKFSVWKTQDLLPDPPPAPTPTPVAIVK